MGCSSCGTAVAASLMENKSNVTSYKSQVISGPCDYTDEILTIWLDKLKWFKNKGLHVKNNVSPALINKYLGIVLTSLNVSNKCVYKTVLDDIAKLITIINGLQ